jgi:hypothetical protein
MHGIDDIHAHPGISMFGVSIMASHLIYAAVKGLLELFC